MFWFSKSSQTTGSCSAMRCWALVDAERAGGWEAATLVSREADSVEILTDSGRTLHLPPDEALAQNESAQDSVSDLAELVHLSEPCVLHALGCRFHNAHIYTYSGAVLLALNPWSELPSLYDETQRQRYLEQPLGAAPPHLFALADVAFRGMLRDGDDQTLLVSGESGAGKTESTKLILSYLINASVEQSQRGRRVGVSAPGGALLQKQLLQANPLLETLGNACTTRNANSSRFGKFIQLRFATAAGEIHAGAVRTYLLEKSRVVAQAAGERNFHIFYQLLRGADAAGLGAQLEFAPGASYNYLRPSASSASSSTAARSLRTPSSRAVGTRGGAALLAEQSRVEAQLAADADGSLAATLQAMSCVGISASHQRQILKCLGGLLHLGDVGFELGEGEGCTVGFGEPETALARACRLWKCADGALSAALCHRTVEVAGEKISVPGQVSHTHCPHPFCTCTHPSCSSVSPDPSSQSDNQSRRRRRRMRGMRSPRRSTLDSSTTSSAASTSRSACTARRQRRQCRQETRPKTRRKTRRKTP